MSTSHAYNHKKQRYRYYRCRASQEGLRCPTGLLNAHDVEAKRLLGAFSSVDAGGRLLAERLGELERETDKHRAGVADLERRLRACAALRTESEHVAKLLDAFDEVWEALVPEERREVLRALIERVGVDPESGTLRVTFHEPAPPIGPRSTTEATA